MSGAKETPSQSLVASPPEGFTSQRTDAFTHALTGTVRLADANSARCGGVGVNLNRQAWVGSELGYFRYQGESNMTLTTCVTTFDSSADASAQQAQVRDFGAGGPVGSPIVSPERFALPSVANGLEEVIGPNDATTYATFSTGRYFVFVMAVGSLTSPTTKAVVSSMVEAELRLLRGAA